jgi:hypothetical protein
MLSRGGAPHRANGLYRHCYFARRFCGVGLAVATMALSVSTRSAALHQARTLLAEQPRTERFAPVAFAAVFFAVSALALALTILTIPPHWAG